MDTYCITEMDTTVGEPLDFVTPEIVRDLDDELKVNIVNLRNVENIQDWLKDTNNVYAGRENPEITGEAKWGNPFKLEDYSSRGEVVDLYRQYIHSDKQVTLLESVGELKGKVLGCWCAPNQCHTEVLHELAGNRPVYADTLVELDTEERDELELDGDNTVLLGDTILDGTKTRRTAVYINKDEPVNESIKAGKFTDIRKVSKRTTKQRQMGVEVFDSASQPIFSQNKSGFCTHRPLEWAIAVEKYEQENDDVKAKWRYKTDDIGKYVECEIPIWFSTTTQITVRIMIVTGVVLVEGPPYRKFIDTEFEKIIEHLPGAGPHLDGGVTSNNLASEGHEPGLNRVESETIWEQIEFNKNAIKVIEESVVKLLAISEETNRRQDLEARVTTADHKDVLLELEKKYDDKLTTFMEAYSKEVSQKIQNISRSFDDKLAKIKDIIAVFKLSTQRQINELYTICGDHDGDRIKKIEENLAKYQDEVSQLINGNGRESDERSDTVYVDATIQSALSEEEVVVEHDGACLLYTSPSPRDS